MSVTPFWITGLPRSRTAWFALAMRGSRSSCYHELTSETRSFAELKTRWLDGGYPTSPFGGNADSACGFHIDRILSEIQPRTLIVDRPVGDVLASLERLFGEPMGHIAPPLERLQDALSVTHPLIKRVRFADLEDRDAVIDAAEWLVPFHGPEAARLMGLNVQVTPKHARSLLALPHSMWHMKEAA